jgi:tetratricopeptide (TPR) repeat protein
MRPMSKPRSPSSAERPVSRPSTEPAGFGSGRSVLLGMIVCCATALAYLPAMKADFIWNDDAYVTSHPLQSLHGLAQIWFKLGATEQYYPLLHSAFWIEHRFFGDDPAGYHILNLLLHLGSTILFAAVLLKLLRERSEASARTWAPFAGDPITAAWLAAAFFALHPVHAATVAWVTEEKNTISLTFYLAAFLCYLRFDETRRARDYLFALALFFLSMLSKTATVTLPAALLVAIWWRRGPLSWTKDVRPLVPWLALGAAAGVFSSWVERHYLGGAGAGAQGADFELSPLGHVLLAGRAIWFYLQSLVWPFNLNFIYPRWDLDAGVFWQWLYPLAAVSALAWFWAMRHRSRTPFAVLALFAGSLFPVLGFVSLYGALYSRVWDHWQYLADLAPLAWAGAGLASAGAWAGPRFRHAGPTLGVTLCLLLGVLTWRRCGDFQNNEVLYRTTLARNPEGWMAHNNLGLLLAQRPAGLPEAIDHYRAALRLRPDYSAAHNNLGEALLQTPGGLTEAIGQFEAALRLDPESAEQHYNYANALARVSGRQAAAVDEYEEALRLKPDFMLAQNNLGIALSHIDGRMPEAIAHFEEAVRLDPSEPQVQGNLGGVLLMVGRTQEAIEHLEAALRLDPSLPQTQMNLAMGLESVGRTAEAAEHYEAARRLGLAVPQPHE